MKVRTNKNGMKQLKDLGFKKIKTEPGFHMYELDPARFDSIKIKNKDSNYAASWAMEDMKKCKK